MAQTTSEVWNTRWSATRRAIRPEVQDNFFEEYAIIDLFRKSGLRMTDNGGKEISVRVATGGGTATAFDTYDVLPKSPVDPVESAHYKRRYYAVPVVLSDTESWENKGEHEVFDQLSYLDTNATSSLLKAINEDMAGAQSGKTMLGFQDIMSDDGTGTVGGINTSNTAAWKSAIYDTSKTFLTQSTTNIFDGIVAWNDIMDKCRIQGGRTSHIVTTFGIVKAYREALSSQGYARTTTEKARGIGGQMNPPFYDAEVVADNDVKASASYFVDKRHNKLNVLKSANFTTTPFVTLQSNGQLAQLAYKVAGVQLTTDNRRRSGVATAITGS